MVYIWISLNIKHLEIQWFIITFHIYLYFTCLCLGYTSSFRHAQVSVLICFVFTHTHAVDDLKGSDAEEDRTAKWKWCLVSGDMQVIVLIINDIEWIL